MLKYFLFLAPVGVAIYYFASPTADYSRTVGRPPHEVRNALADLDITDAPGAPGTDASKAGGVTPVIKLERLPDRLVWKVMSGNRVATTMTATLTPVEDGKQTLVTASVERGDAPDDFVSPAFRSEGITLGLFSMALEDELNELVPVLAANMEDCVDLYVRFENSNLNSPDLRERSGLRDGVGDVAKSIVKLNAADAEARRLGCDKYDKTELRLAVEQRVEPGPRTSGNEDDDGGWGAP